MGKKGKKGPYRSQQQPDSGPSQGGPSQPDPRAVAPVRPVQVQTPQNVPEQLPQQRGVPGPIRFASGPPSMSGFPQMGRGAPVRLPMGPGAPVRPPMGRGAPVGPPMGPGAPVGPPMGPGAPGRPPMGLGAPGRPPMGPGAPVGPPMGPGAPGRPPMGPGAPVRPPMGHVATPDQPQSEPRPKPGLSPWVAGNPPETAAVSEPERKFPDPTRGPPHQPRPEGERGKKKKREPAGAGKNTGTDPSQLAAGVEALSIGQTLPKAEPQPTGAGRGRGKKATKEPSATPATGDKDIKPAAEVSDGKALTKELMKQGGGGYSIPKRKNAVIKHKPQYVDRKIIIDVNYLPLTFSKPDLQIFHYDVAFKPDRPKGLFRLILEQMKKRYYPNRFPAFDGNKNLYAGGSRLFKGDSIRDSVEIVDPEDGRTREYDVTIKIANDKLNMSLLMKYMTSKTATSAELPMDVIQATDIALRGGLFNRFLPVGRSFFSSPAGVDLGGGLELWDGFFQSAIMAWKPYLNVDVANKGFPINQDVISFLRTLRDWNDEELRQGLTDYHKSDLQKYIRGLKVQYEVHGDMKRTFKVNGLSLNAEDYKFDCKGQMMSVLHYYQREKRTQIKFPKLPLLHVGPLQKNTMVPLEFCTIIGRQVVMRKLDERQTSTMVRNAATSTDRRRSRTMGNINSANYNRDPTLQEFGIVVNTNFAKVESTVFRPPSIEYRASQVMPRNGVWRMDRQSFKNSPPLQNWAVLVKDNRTRPDAVQKTVSLLISCGRQVGFEVNQPRHIMFSHGYQDMSEVKILQNLRDLQKQFGPLQIVLVIMAGNPPDLYNRIKRASELQAGVLTQCLKSNTVFKMNPMTAGNILLKLNAKVSGVNHALGAPQKPVVFNQPVMFVGADVTHPAPGSDGSPSIAAVAASFDQSGFKYNMLYNLQPSRMEMIRDLEAMMCQQLEHFQKMTRGILPLKILYYRDGVSEGQFDQILSIELRAMRSACLKIGAKLGREYKPGITFLVVQKRHHTRFFPNPKDGDGSRNNNVLAGTIVDREITHPTELDFYLVSHQSIQGTARPTKYHVLWDDNDFEEDDLEILTYYLCYMFSRCNRSVSYPAPTYYAHLGAFRARAYWDGQKLDMAQLKTEQERRGTIQPGITDYSPMFFV